MATIQSMLARDDRESDEKAGALCQGGSGIASLTRIVERFSSMALAPDHMLSQQAAMGQFCSLRKRVRPQASIGNGTMRRERARLRAERARTQYDTREPENRLVAPVS